MRDRTARTLEFAARMQKRRQSIQAAVAPLDPPVLSIAEAERLKAKAASLLASLEKGSAAESEIGAGEEDQFTPMEEVASVSGLFEPAALAKALSLDGASEMSALSRLASLCSVEPTEQRTFWLLHSDRRSACLQWLAARRRLTAVLDRPLPPTDRKGEMLRNILRNAPPPLDTLEREDLLAVSWSLEALASVDVPKPAITEVQQRLARTQFLASYEMLLVKDFVGRDSELARLSAFVQGPEPGRRWLLLSGLGGAGKSTLLAKFARDTANLGTATVVVLDFDRPGIDGRDTLWLEMEMARQVGAQYPQYDEMLRRAREEVRETSADKRHSQEAYSSDALESGRGSRFGLLHPIAEVLSNAGQGHSFLLILDTFEEVAQRELTGKVLDWLGEVESLLWPTPLRVIISGRVLDNLQGFLQGYQVEQILVDEFPPEIAEVFLRKLGVSETAAARLAASDVLPRRPLELKLVAKLIADSPASSIDDLERELREGGNAARDLFAGLVYRRVLLRISVPDDEREVAGSLITDDLLRKLAYPGLVLRYVTPALVQKVLAPALELPELNDTQAAKALELLARHEWLAYRQQDEVWPRRDLRRSVLKPVLAENPERTKRIQKLAIAYFEKAPDERGRSEALYHRLMSVSSDEDGAGFDLDVLRKASSSFETDLSDLPPSGAALLRFAIEGEVEVEKVQLLPRVFREPAYQAKGALLVNSREFGLGLRLYCHSDKHLADWERTLLLGTGEWDELRSRLGDLSGIRDWRDLGEYLFPAAVIDSLNVKQLGMLQLSKPERELLGVGFATSLQMLSVGLVMVVNGAGLPANMRQSLMEALPLFENVARIDPVLEKRLIYLKLLTAPEAVERLPIGPSTIRLDPTWLDEAPAFLSNCGEVPTGALKLFTTVRGLATDGIAGKRDARTFLSFVQNEKETFFLSLDRTSAESEALWRFLEGPNPEFRDPTRFALLEAFPDVNSYAALAGLLKSVVPFRLDDLEPETFKQAIVANPEHALEAYVELVDRIGGLETLLRKAMAMVPNSLKPKAVCDSLKRWRVAAEETVLTTKLNNERESLNAC
jgi:hypothetical protein